MLPAFLLVLEDAEDVARLCANYAVATTYRSCFHQLYEQHSPQMHDESLLLLQFLLLSPEQKTVPKIDALVPLSDILFFFLLFLLSRPLKPQTDCSEKLISAQ